METLLKSLRKLTRLIVSMNMGEQFCYDCRRKSSMIARPRRTLTDARFYFQLLQLTSPFPLN